jgi:hypothetical protein
MAGTTKSGMSIRMEIRGIGEHEQETLDRAANIWSRSEPLLCHGFD